MYYKSDWEMAKKRLTALWDQELIDRCCVSVAAPKDGRTNVHIFAQGECNPEDPLDVADYWMNPQRIWKRNIRRLEQTYFGGESPPRGNYLLSMPDNCGTLDAIGHLHGSTNVLMDMYDCPEALSAGIAAINHGWTDAAETFYQLEKECNEGGACVGWLDTWAPGRSAQMQCDMSVMFLTDLYGRFVVPELKKQMEWEEYPVYHFDGKEQINHLDHLLALKEIRMIERIKLYAPAEARTQDTFLG